MTVVALYQWMRILQLETEFAVEESSLRGNVYMHKDETLSPMNVGDVRLERKNKEIELLKAELKKLEKVKKLQVKGMWLLLGDDGEIGFDVYLGLVMKRRSWSRKRKGSFTLVKSLWSAR